jgi:hypothetical protein
VFSGDNSNGADYLRRQAQNRDFHCNWFLQRPKTGPSLAATLRSGVLSRHVLNAPGLRLRYQGVRENRSTMKMTIFKGNEVEVEKEINNWLKAERINKIRHVTHVNYGATVYITVWWHPLDSRKNASMAHGLS